MANLSEAYDFSLFEDRIGQSTAPIGEPGSREQRQEQKRENVIELPQKDWTRTVSRNGTPSA